MSKIIVIANGLWGTPETVRGVGLMEQLEEMQNTQPYEGLTRERLEEVIRGVFNERPQRTDGRQTMLFQPLNIHNTQMFDNAMREAANNW